MSTGYYAQVIDGIVVAVIRAEPDFMTGNPDFPPDMWVEVPDMAEYPGIGWTYTPEGGFQPPLGWVKPA